MGLSFTSIGGQILENIKKQIYTEDKFLKLKIMKKVEFSFYFYFSFSFFFFLLGTASMCFTMMNGFHIKERTC